MPKLFDMFKFAKFLNISDGEIKVWNIPMNIIPTFVLREWQKDTINEVGYQKAFEKIYSSAKEGSEEYNQNFIKKQGFKYKRQIINWQTRIVSLSGWGQIEIAKIDFEKNEYVAHFKENPFARTYGKTTYPIDFLICGFISGGFSASLGKELDCIETKCVAKGDAYCEFVVGKPDKIKKLKTDQWKKLKTK
jgi:predicted hydrocarbon binding protein